MKLVYDYPPNYAAIAEAFNIKSHENVIFTYGDELYIPAGEKIGKIDKPLMRHEETHARQQKEMGIEVWWDKFLTDPDFRLAQELEAYREQYRAMASISPEKRMGYLNHIARDLSSEIYGNMLTFQQAFAVITEGIVLNSPGSQRKNKILKARKLERKNRKKSRR